MCDRWESPVAEYVLPVKREGMSGRAAWRLLSKPPSIQTKIMFNGVLVTCRSVELGYVIQILYATF